MVKVFPSSVNRHRPRTDVWDSWGGGEVRARETCNKCGTEVERRCGVIRARTGEGSRQGRER